MKALSNILNEIKDFKIQEVAKRKALYSEELLKQSKYFDSPTISLQHYIKREDKSGIIAEFKRRSPSKPNINLYANPEQITIGYMQGGASALSVLTDENYFGGSSEDLSTAREFNYCPILRKDFTVDKYQILEAKSIGADAILLIAEILTKSQIKEFTDYANELELEVLLELHSEQQLDKFYDGIDLIGVNNRDLQTFEVDFKRSIELISKLPQNKVKIAESGIRNSEEIKFLKENGFDGFLIGELFMKEPKPAYSCRQIVEEISR